MDATILLVEDDMMTRVSLLLVLERSSYQVIQAASGEEALAHLGDHTFNHPRFEVVITDLQIGSGVDGIEVVRAARSQPVPPEVIVLTSSASLEPAIEALRAGASDYMIKPYAPADLLERVRIAVHHHREQAQKMMGLRKIAEAAAEMLRQHEQYGYAHVPMPRNLTEQATRKAPPTPQSICIGQLHINLFIHTASFQDRPLHLTPIEYELLRCLAEAHGGVVRYADIVRRTHQHHVSDTEAYVVLKWHVRNLRRKLAPGYLVSVRGMGYKLTIPDKHKQVSDSSAHQ